MHEILDILGSWREYEYQFGPVFASCQLSTCHRQYFALSAIFPKTLFPFINKKHSLSFLVNKVFSFTIQKIMLEI